MTSEAYAAAADVARKKGFSSTSAFIRAAVEAAIDECDRFYPVFQFILWGDKTPAEALASAMVDAAGVSVTAMRYQALALNGVLASMAGSYLVLAQNPNFIPNMTAGRGYMALAAMIFGKWHPVGALWACLLFGCLDAIGIRLQGVALPDLLGGGAVPVQAIQALPYVMTVVLLAGFIGTSVAPQALGRPYVKER